jgi:tetratricopeptide (TPR) repeat protein
MNRRIALWHVAVVVVVSAVSAGGLAAQCPDGAPPPCARPPVPATAARTANPPLDERTWIVVPFDNLSQDASADWLRGASVNLLYLDMSRWQDIRVIDDERVADLVRETPEAANARQLSLNAGLAIAKRAGAGKLVMGDVLRLGARTTVTAKVFDVRRAQRLRSVREEVLSQDSLMPSFARLARRVLNVAPPAGANLGALGTTRVDAYQEYITGVEALNRYDLATARRHLNAALRLDSTFALAHYKLTITIGWADVNDPSRRRHAEAANRLSTGLPPRERALIAGLLQQASGQWSAACATYTPLVRADSADVEAWYGLGECLFHDLAVEPIDGDTTRMRFRGNIEHAIRAFDRVLTLDPSYHLAYQHIIDALSAERSNLACYRRTPDGGCVNYHGMYVRSGDSLVVTPARFLDFEAMRTQADAYLRARSRARNLEVAERYATAWVQASPAESQARRALTRVYILQGRIADAEAQSKLITSRGSPLEETRLHLERIEIAFKLGRGNDAVQFYDSVRTSSPVIPGAGFRVGNAVAGFGPVFGRIQEFDSLLVANMRASGAPESIQRYVLKSNRALLTGMADDSLAAAELAAFELARGRGLPATRTIASTLMFALRAPRASWPTVDTTVRDLRLAPAAALASRDTARLRAAAMALDSLALMVANAGAADSGYSLAAAEAYLAAGDSVAALRAVRFALDRAAVTTAYFPSISSNLPPVFFVPRTMLLRADLAAAAGSRDEARTWYTRFIDIWSTAVPELQPVVERARRSLAALDASR